MTSRSVTVERCLLAVTSAILFGLLLVLYSNSQHGSTVGISSVLEFKIPDDLPVSRSNDSMTWWQWAMMIERQLHIQDMEYKCKDLRKMGNWPVCFDEPYTPRRPCLVYSFGINHDFRFDDAMAAVGCEVFSFDPSMGIGDHKHAPLVTFKALGIGDSDAGDFSPYLDSYVHKPTTWKIMTLKSIRKMLGHENRSLDVLKLDIEVYEWDVMRNLMEDDQLKSVRQLDIEWHIFANRPSHSQYKNMSQLITRFQEAGFRMFHMATCCLDHNRGNFNSQADTCYVNTKYKAPDVTNRK